MKWKILGLAAAAICLLGEPALAQSKSAAMTAAGTRISVGGEWLFRLRASEGGYTAAQRADQVRERMIPILSLEEIRDHDIVVRRAGNQYASIYVRDRLLVTVGPNEAAAHGTTPVILANQWARRLRVVLPQVAANQWLGSNR